MPEKNKGGRPNLEEMIVRMSKISLTEYQMAELMNVEVEEIMKHEELIKKNLPCNYEKVRFRRFRKSIIEKKEFDYMMKKQDPKFRIKNSLGALMRYHLKKNETTKPGKLEEVLGYSISELKEHLESKFEPWMNWDNYGTEWHIDHVVPASWFNYQRVEDIGFKKCWELENLQPLSVFENISKNNRWAG